MAAHRPEAPAPAKGEAVAGLIRKVPAGGPLSPT